MKRYTLLTLLGLSLLVGHASAKTPTIWNRGELFLENGTELTGDLNYNWKAEVVQIRQGDAIKAYSAFQVQAFRFFDNSLNTLRTFASVQDPAHSSLHRLLFMEQVMTGPMTVYRRLHHMREPIASQNPASFGSDAELVKDLDGFDYFVYENDSIISLDKFSQELWPVMQQECGDELTHYASTLAIDKSSTVARLRIINRYNSLKSQPASAHVAPYAVQQGQ
jgi:hypothetical protein